MRPGSRQRCWLQRPGWEKNSNPFHLRKVKSTISPNFIGCVFSQKKEGLRALIEKGHYSSGLVHPANASYRLGRTLDCDPESEQVKNDDEGNRLLREDDEDTGRHLWCLSTSKPLQGCLLSRRCRSNFHCNATRLNPFRRIMCSQPLAEPCPLQCLGR